MHVHIIYIYLKALNLFQIVKSFTTCMHLNIESKLKVHVLECTYIRGIQLL